MNTRLLFGLLWLTPTLCFGALSTTTSYFLNVEALTNVTARSTVLADSGVLTNNLQVASPVNPTVPFLRTLPSTGISTNKTLVIASETVAGATNGIQIGDAGTLSVTTNSFPVQMGIFRQGWSLMGIRNTYANNGTTWTPILNVNTNYAAQNFWELGAEGFSVQGLYPTYLSSTNGTMQFSVRQQDRRLPNNTFSARGEKWIQLHNHVFARFTNNYADNMYQGSTVNPMIWLQQDGGLTNGMITLDVMSATSTGARMRFTKANGSPESPIAAAINAIPMLLDSCMYDGAGYQLTARILTIGKTAVSSGVAGQSIRLVTGATDTASLATRVEVDYNGNVGIGPSTSPHSTLHVQGSAAYSVATGTAFTLTATNDFYLVNVDAQTVTLPTAVGVSGRTYTIKAIAPCTTATVATTSSQLIDGATTYSLSASNKFVRVISDNARWWIIGQN